MDKDPPAPESLPQRREQLVPVRYDTIRYFSVRSKADTSQLYLPHGTKNEKVENRKTIKSKQNSEVSVNSPGNPRSQSRKEKEGYGKKDLQKRKVFFNFFSLGRKSEGVTDDESGESMKPMEEVTLVGLGKSELERGPRPCT